MSYEEEIAFGVQQMLDTDLQFPQDVPVRNVVKTNADHIRSMTDEELGAYLLCPRDFDPKWWCCDIHCHVCVTDWLKQPYGGDT